ncbi:MAG: serine hydrolase [Christensenellaceae bacterium]|nr:serine hydrolase [Christensenellaceae bacterium]
MTRELQTLHAIENEMRALPGHLGFYYKNLVTGQSFSVRADESYAAASVIKLPLYLHILAEADKGRLCMDDVLTVKNEDKVPICGALTLFTDEIRADIATLCRLMISLSDNTATNVLIRHLGIPAIAQGFEKMGLTVTRLARCLFDMEANARGLSNFICPQEIGMLLEKLYKNEFVSPEVCRTALDTLMLQQIGHKLNGKLCERLPLAHKTGEDTGISNDVGVVYAAQPFVICFAGHDTDVYPWEDLMRRAAYDLALAVGTSL